MDLEEQERLFPTTSPPTGETATEDTSPPEITPADTSLTTATVTQRRGPMELVNSLLTIARSATSSSSSSSRPVATQPEYVALPEVDSDDESYFTVKSTPGGEEMQRRLCPDTLEEMLQIVRELRKKRMEAMQNAALQNTSVVTLAQQEKRAAIDHLNNFTKINMDDFC